ncbi:pyridine nucleotide-disulfide oxidoreductase [Pseudogracilibacillus auburnensis]|uniref:Pyridine nucleotide-disulfide oxidoreductase n=1 Tax=Pseudogracilibacillus auburnensis TaxID=1494959 RepID=A0A2V3W5A6_9BACI|nr:pyridine nucleotide-disulfide oxidoreductase [Pseudogracilibacillus auburnensis]
MQINDVVIIGAGPAGLSAAIQCRENDLRVTVLDEFPKPGGRLLGQLHQEPTGEWWNGIEETKILVDKAEKLNTDIRCGVSVHHIEKLEDHFVVHTNKKNFPAKNILIATGAAETAAPIPGWTLPGVMSIGAAQVMTNVHRVSVGEKGIVVGVNVLSAAIARELQLAGIDLHSMALPARNAVSEDQANPRLVMERLVRIAHLAPSAFIKFGSKFAKFKFVQNIALQFFPKGGVKMWDMPIHLRKAIKEINGTDKVESVTMVDVTVDGDIIRGTEETIPVDFVCIAGGLYPLAELAAVVGVPFQYSEELGGHVPIHNEAMETSMKGIYVAGNITGIESAKVAREQGAVAGLSIVKNTLQNATVDGKLKVAINNVKATREAATIQFHPRIEEGREKVTTAFNQLT